MSVARAADGDVPSETTIPNDLVNSLVFVMCKYLHVVCTTLLVGGTLFYEMVVPVAIGELKRESQLAVFGRAGWVFRWIVWLCALVLIITGIMLTRQYWSYYAAAQVPVEGPQYRPGWWWAAHMTSGSIAIVISLMLTIGSAPPEKPVTWMRFNLMLLLVVMFVASATRHVRDLQISPPPQFVPNPLLNLGEEDEHGEGNPTTHPTTGEASRQ